VTPDTCSIDERESIKMSSEYSNHSSDNETHRLSESEWAGAIYSVVRTLCEQGLVARNPRYVRIKRVGRKPVYPCRRSSGPDLLDLSQLEKAAQDGKYWFLGPITSLEIAFGELRPGQLELEPGRMTFSLYLSTLNYDDFKATGQRIIELLDRFGCQVGFHPIRNSFNTRLTISEEKALSPQNALQFLETVGEVMTHNV
jgi:hypothetical protein